ncbi:outer membrane lipoprotein chaperone LolA [Zwartia vadi]|uniref:outer membrane lipoprotein chaperone LolA n=1 Tax=Zwartia vadi TaxID=3058168 RepID=UPI0025B5D7F3|nr:outer membrane lipoprotein chaperone LolA [Zwartia vadi]MDN3985994.1 outer membrane lipoprotein chaperone LolA [Zwartia vadi]
MTRMRMLWMSGLLGCLAAVLTAPAYAQTAREQLKSFVEQVQSASGDFAQYTVGPQGQTKPAQRGKFLFMRPGRFKWDVLKPYEQQIVSNGREVFQFDPDLNQVTVRKFDQAVGASPAAILFGSGSFEQSFDVTALPNKESLVWLRAKPRQPDAGFVHVDLAFKDGIPHRIILLDAFGQTTHVELSALVRNPGLSTSNFDFVAPKGADVVRMQ